MWPVRTEMPLLGVAYSEGGAYMLVYTVVLHHHLTSFDSTETQSSHLMPVF
jgi:hypothetical protein